MKPPPAGWPRMSASVYYDDPLTAIDWLTTAFGVDAHHAQAVAAGAEIIRELRTDDYGVEYWKDRTYGALDPEGHLWWFIQRVS